MNIGIYNVTHGVALRVTTFINTNKSKNSNNVLRNVVQHLMTSYSDVIILFKTHLFVRENVRLYNCVGLVSDAYFVFDSFIRKDYLGLYG